MNIVTRCIFSSLVSCVIVFSATNGMSQEVVGAVPMKFIGTYWIPSCTNPNSGAVDNNDSNVVILNAGSVIVRLNNKYFNLRPLRIMVDSDAQFNYVFVLVRMGGNPVEIGVALDTVNPRAFVRLERKDISSFTWVCSSKQE